MDERRVRIARDNHGFFYADVGLAMCSELFVSAVLYSTRDGSAQYGIEHGGHFGGYIRIDSSDIRNTKSVPYCDNFRDAVRDGRLLGRVAMKMTHSITGEMNTEAVVTEDIYRFHFKITKYERDSEHGFGMVDDPTLVPDDEHLGRFIELKITLAS